MKNKARLFILLALAPIIIGLAGFDSTVDARHRRYAWGLLWRGVRQIWPMLPGSVSSGLSGSVSGGLSGPRLL